jgi:hypothetical protein
MELVGNEIANAFYLGKKNQKFLQGQPLTFGDSNNRRRHMKKKYVEKAFSDSDMVSPADFVKQNGFNLKKEDMISKYLGGQNIPKVNPNKKKPISLKGLKKSSQKKKTENAMTDLLDMDFDITPASKAPADLWDFSTQKTDPVPSSTKPQVSSNNILDFDFGMDSKPAKDTNDFLDLGGNTTSSAFPKPPTKSPQIFQTNPTPNNIQNDKYNCLSFNPPPINKNYFYSNQANGGNNWNAQVNPVRNEVQRNKQVNNWGMMNKNKNTVPDKYDVFDMCLNNNRNGYFN